MSHTCHAIGCNRQCPPRMLMCRLCWRRVPKHLQKAVYANYRPGQEIDKRPTREWHRAADAAINSLIESEAPA